MDENQKIIDRLMAKLDVDGQTALAIKLGRNRNTVSTWFKRNAIPLEEVVAAAITFNLSLDELILGRVASVPPPQPEASARASIASGPDNRTDGLWRVLETVDRQGPITEEELTQNTGLDGQDVARLCLQLHRRRLLRRTPDGWVAVELGIMRADTDEELAALSKQVMALFQRHILPGAARTSGAIALCEVRVKADMPGEAIMQTIRETLQAQNVADGLPLIVAIGVAPAEEHGIIDSRSGADDG